MSRSRPSPLVREKASSTQANSFSHPLNPNSQVEVVGLSGLVGLERTGVSLATVKPGKESYIYHSHECEEEWIYILSGTGMAEIDGKEFEVGAGDFMGFPTPSVAHHLRNDSDEDLVYLMGGERRRVEIADFPHIGKRMLRRGEYPDMRIDFYDIEAGESLAVDDFIDE